MNKEARRDAGADRSADCPVVPGRTTSEQQLNQTGAQHLDSDVTRLDRTPDGRSASGAGLRPRRCAWCGRESGPRHRGEPADVVLLGYRDPSTKRADFAHRKCFLKMLSQPVDHPKRQRFGEGREA